MWDEAAIAELYRRHGHALYQRCLTLIGNRADAQELLQETFCQFLQVVAQEKFQGRSSAFTFLYRIATNITIDRLRRRRTAGVQVPIDEPVFAASVADTSTSRRLQAAQELAALTRGLDEETLTIAVMAHVDGMTQDEIALTLDLSRRTVGKRLQRFSSAIRGRGEPADGASAARAKVEAEVEVKVKVEEAHGE